MADKRMFSLKIIDSDAFMDMPLSTQALYYHLAMRADDDGFVNNPRKIQRSIGASDDDLRILAAKRYILTFPSGVICIKHWKIHNTVRSDRYKPTSYTEEKETLVLKENGSYTERNRLGIPSGNQVATNGIPSGNQVATNGIPSGNQVTTQYSVVENSIEEVSIGECKENNTPARERYGEFQNVVLSRQEYEKLTESIGSGFRDDYINRLDLHIEQKGVTYRSHYATILKWYFEDHPKKSGGSFDTDEFYAMAIAASYKDGGG